MNFTAIGINVLVYFLSLILGALISLPIVGVLQSLFRFTNPKEFSLLTGSTWGASMVFTAFWILNFFGQKLSWIFILFLILGLVMITFQRAETENEWLRSVAAAIGILIMDFLLI